MVAAKGYFSDRKPVISGVPRASMQGPLLFVTYSNHLGDNVQDIYSKFAYETKIIDIMVNNMVIKSFSNILISWASGMSRV